MVNMRGKLIGLPTFIVRSNETQGVNFAVATDTISAFLSAPQAAVATAPKPPVYTGDPRAIALKLTDVTSNDLLFESQDTSTLSSGYYKVMYSRGRRVLYSYVHVYADNASAKEVWKNVFTKLDPHYETYWTALSMGDAAFTTRNSDGELVRAYALVKNVVVSVTLDGGPTQPSADITGLFARIMVDRVNVQAR